MDAVFENALRKRDAARYETAKLREQLAKASDEEKRWDEFLRMYGEVAPRSAIDAGEVTRAIRNEHATMYSKPRESGGALAATELAAVEILTRVGRPIPTRELHDLLTEFGIEIGGQDPISTLSARLSRAPKLLNIRSKGWWIRGESGGDTVAGHQPPDSTEADTNDPRNPSERP